jgi:hypothetical protein
LTAPPPLLLNAVANQKPVAQTVNPEADFGKSEKPSPSLAGCARQIATTTDEASKPLCAFAECYKKNSTKLI